MPSVPRERRRCGRRRAGVRPGLAAGLALALLAGGGCVATELPAYGDIGQVGLVTSLPPEDPAITRLRGWLERDAATTLPEPAYRLILHREGERNDRKGMVVLVDLGSGQGRSLADRLIGESDARRIAALPAWHHLYRNIWATGQGVLLLHARDAASLESYLAERGEEIFGAFGACLIDALQEGLYLGGEEERLGDAIRDRHGFRLRVPTGYRLAERPGMVQIGRTVIEEPKRWLMIAYGPREETPVDLSEWMKRRDSALPGDRREDRSRAESVRSRQAVFRGASCLAWEGVWKNDSLAIGGPLLGYGFVSDGRYYLIDMAVFHPPGPKLPALRQLLAIARTFGA